MTASKTSLLAGILVVSCASAFTTSHQGRPSFVGPLCIATSPVSPLSVDTPVRLAEAEHGMPWRESIDSKVKEQGAEVMLYMPFWEWQLEFMETALTDLEVLDCITPEGRDVSYEESAAKDARIVNLHLKSKEYSKIRMTYYDAGEATQVFNSVWYPAEGVDAPVLGMDLLSFNRKKFLAIVDFQPLHSADEEPSKAHNEAKRIRKILEPVKGNYPSLDGQMSSKFYDETMFFSKQHLFGRFEDDAVVSDELFPAFQDYVKAHVNMVRESADHPSARSASMKHYLGERVRAYDAYSAERDPATGFFASKFGADWADDFVFGFLFSKSRSSEATDSVRQEDDSSSSTSAMLSKARELVRSRR